MPLILLPLLRFVIALLSISFPRARRGLTIFAHILDASWLAILITALAHGTPIRITVGTVPVGIGISMAGDRIGLTFAALAWGLSVAASLYVWKDRLRPYFYLLMHLLIGTCYALAFTKDLFNAYLLFELLTLVSYLLVGYGRSPRQIWASLRYLILSSFGMSIFLLGISVVYAHCGSLDIEIVKSIAFGDSAESWTFLAGSLLVAGIAVKAGVFTFSLWLPSAHARAMPVVSALLSGLVIKMGVLEMFRLADLFPIGLPLVVMGSVTGLLGILYAVTTYDMKKMLAFHTLSQIGYILIGLGAGTYLARLGALTYAVAHGLFKALLFLAVGEAAACVGSARWDTLVEHRQRIPWGTRVALLAATLGIVGLPPLAGFDAKAILEGGLTGWTLHIVVIAISVGTALSFAKFAFVLASRSTSRTQPNRAMAYTWLGGAIVLFWPLSMLMTSPTISMGAIDFLHLVEALAAIATGAAVYSLIRKRRFRLPMAIFRLEQGPLAILGGFFVVYVLILAGR